MLRETSTRIGTAMSVAATGGLRTIGLQTKNTTAARASARSAVRVARWTTVSGANGRRYEMYATTATAAATTTASHHGIGEAKCMQLSRVGFRLSALGFGRRAA